MPANADVSSGDFVQVDIPIDVRDTKGLQLRYWEADYCNDVTGGRGAFVKQLLVDGKEVSRCELFGDGSWIERRFDLSEHLKPNGKSVLSLRIEATSDNSAPSPVHVW